MSAAKQVWLFGPRTDVAVFAGSAVFSALMVAAGRAMGVEGDTPVWAWVLFVLCIDVSHVWATLYRVYFDGDEVRRRPVLYFGAPLAALAVGVAAYGWSPGTFWRFLAYAALIHFVRQQYGWVALYDRKAQASRLDFRLDAAAIYASTIAPVLWWHANLPRPFWWFMTGDFASGLPHWVGTVALAVHAVILAVWLGRQVQLLFRGSVQWGKVLLVAATWAAWFGGIILAQDDYAFTVMNVVLHGVPYFALSFRYAQGRGTEGGYSFAARLLRFGVPGFLSVLVACAYFEEWLWDHFVWHDHFTVFGDSAFALPTGWFALVVPLLALPQATHYVLDAFTWRPSADPSLVRRLGWAPVSSLAGR